MDYYLTILIGVIRRKWVARQVSWRYAHHLCTTSVRGQLPFLWAVGDLDAREWNSDNGLQLWAIPVALHLEPYGPPQPISSDHVKSFFTNNYEGVTTVKCGRREVLDSEDSVRVWADQQDQFSQASHLREYNVFVACWLLLCVNGTKNLRFGQQGRFHF